MEKWYAIPGYPNYDITRNGAIRNNKTDRILSPTKTKKGYLRIGITNESGIKHFGIHQLVLIAFVGPKPIGYHACHLNDDKSNNHIDNLRWGTPQDNALMQTENKKRAPGEGHGRSKLTWDDAQQIRKEYKLGMGVLLGKKYGVDKSTIQRIIRGEMWPQKHHGPMIEGK